MNDLDCLADQSVPTPGLSATRPRFPLNESRKWHTEQAVQRINQALASIKEQCHHAGYYDWSFIDPDMWEVVKENVAAIDERVKRDA